MSGPTRVQRRRTAKWRAPKGAVYVGRGSKWGNPFKGEQGAATSTREMLADDYREWLTRPVWTDPRNGRVTFAGRDNMGGVPYAGRPSTAEIMEALAGRTLMCWCPTSQPCHADVLLDIANRDITSAEANLRDVINADLMRGLDEAWDGFAHDMMHGSGKPGENLRGLLG